jgi:hypothetical protein
MSGTDSDPIPSLAALSRQDVTALLAAIEAIAGEKRRARADGKLSDFGYPFRPTAWVGRTMPERDKMLIGILADLSQDARDELQALFYFGRDETPLSISLKHVKLMGGGIEQIDYLYSKLLQGEEWLRKGLLKLDFCDQ